ncbi:hypothetical protein V6N11_065396 [Hibiscus sabdariffa]|uniref:Cyclin N-terminal domain-containing protein n=1 Tax=Hibiscus sabdariffa TaxID=183260 RepID=A0ABR2AAW3_9ROSI
MKEMKVGFLKSPQTRRLVSSSPLSTAKRPPITGNQSKKRVTPGHIPNQVNGLLTQSKPMESPASSIFKSLEGLEELYGSSSLERAEHEETFVDPIITRESLECSESFDEIMRDESVSEFMSTDTNENNSRKIAVDHDIYKNLRDFEAVQRPSTDYMETVQRDINAEMRASLIDGLVRATENKRILLPPETLCMTVNYIDRYLSGISINRQQLQLLGLACMLIAYKHESVKSAVPKVIVLCNITGKTYHKAEIVQMESAVLNHLNFEMSVPTAYYFLAQFICAAKTSNQDHPLQWECLSSYILELSLVEYSMLQYAQPLIAASAAFLARFILSPLEKPWDSKLRDYTLYQPSDLVECVMTLHRLYRNRGSPNSAAIRGKYSQSKYFFVATRDCHATIPDEFFQDVSN